MQRDPVERASDDGDDEGLYGVATWEPRSRLDRLAVWVHGAITVGLRVLLVAFAVLVLAALFASDALSATVTDATASTLVLLSAAPALALATFVWRTDVTTSEPAGLLVATFLLGLLFAPLAGIVNSYLLGGQQLNDLSPTFAVPFFFLVVGPGEEAVKLLAVWLYAYRDSRFDAVIDGAVYGAAAGLGFATIENALYIAEQLPAGGGGGVGITAVRALAGPGHVIYSAIAGYYLGLAKFNRESAGPIVVKGLLLAAVVHAGYNTLVGVVPAEVAATTSLSPAAVFVGFVIVYDSLAGYLLYRKLTRYRRAYRAVRADETADPSPELTEFERTVDAATTDGGPERGD